MAHGQGTASPGRKRVGHVQPDTPERTQPRAALGSSVLLWCLHRSHSPALYGVATELLLSPTLPTAATTTRACAALWGEIRTRQRSTGAVGAAPGPGGLSAAGTRDGSQRGSNEGGCWGCPGRSCPRVPLAPARRHLRQPGLELGTCPPVSRWKAEPPRPVPLPRRGGASRGLPRALRAALIHGWAAARAQLEFIRLLPA